MEFIRTLDLVLPKFKPIIPEGALILPKEDAERIRRFVYYWGYLFRLVLQQIYDLLRVVKSPKEAEFYEAVNEIHLRQLERTLELNGLPITELNCYKFHTANA